MLITVLSPSEVPISIMIITCNDIPVISLVLLLLAMGHKLVKILYKLITKFYKTA